jgi:hypothetical protein
MTILRVAFTSSVALALAATIATAQDQTLIDSGASRGGFGGPIMRLTRIADKDAFMMGGRGAFILAGTYAIGGGGIGWSSENVRGRDGQRHQLDVGYGGLDLEYVHRTGQLVHTTAQVTIGGGGATMDADGSGAERNDAFFVIEPGINAELNVTKGFRFGVGVAYRFVNGINLTAFTDDDLSGASAVITFKFGRFR